MTIPVGDGGVPRRNVATGSGALTPDFAVLYGELFRMQHYLLNVCSSRNPDHLLAGFDAIRHSLVRAALVCDDEARKRRRNWTPSTEYKHRWHRVKSFDDEHPYWDHEYRYIQDFFDQRLMHRMVRNAKSHLQTMYTRSADYEGPLISEAPISEYLSQVISIAEYRRTHRGREKSRRKAKKWAKVQLKIVKSSAILVADCINYGPRDKDAETVAAHAFEVSYALAMGASKRDWKAV